MTIPSMHATIFNLTATATALREGLKSTERDYLLDDHLVMQIRPYSTTWRKRVPGGIQETSRIEIETNLAPIDDPDGGCVSLDSERVSSAALMKWIEIKSMLEQWKAGEIEIMPPSTFTPKDEDVEYVVGRGHRRRRIRVDE